MSKENWNIFNLSITFSTKLLCTKSTTQFLVVLTFRDTIIWWLYEELKLCAKLKLFFFLKTIQAIPRAKTIKSLFILSIFFSQKCSDYQVSDKKTYSTFARTLPPSSKVSKSVVALLKKFDWDKIVLVVCQRRKDRWYQNLEAFNVRNTKLFF